MGKYRKPFFIMCFLLIIVLISGYLYKRNNAPQEIEALQLKKGDAQLVLAVVGRVRTKDVVNIRVEFAGKITKLLVDEGDKVKRGDTIAEVRSASQQAILASAKADLKASEAQLDFAQHDFDRISELSKKGLVANFSVDQARSNLATAQAKVIASQEARNQAIIRVNDNVIQSPIDGIVLSRPIDQGQVVGLSDTLFQIGSAGPIEIEAEVDEIYASALSINMQALLAPTGKQLVVKGRITEISPRVNPLNGSRLTRLMLNELNADFVPGRSIDVNILVHSCDEALSAPRSALRKEGNNWLVCTIVNETVKSSVVTFVDWPGSSVVLTSGLNSGAVIALDSTIAAAALAKNQRVSAKEMKL
jgi:RND family efflux transporter MFP subunit